MGPVSGFEADKRMVGREGRVRWCGCLVFVGNCPQWVAGVSPVSVWERMVGREGRVRWCGCLVFVAGCPLMSAILLSFFI